MIKALILGANIILMIFYLTLAISRNFITVKD